VVAEVFSRGVGVLEGDHEASMADRAFFFNRADGVKSVLLFEAAYFSGAEVVFELASGASEADRG
jgi:hypothetical protein